MALAAKHVPEAQAVKRTRPGEYYYIETREEFIWMLKILNKYLAQRIITAEGEEEKPRLAVDTETFREEDAKIVRVRRTTTKLKRDKENMPRPIWTGKHWLGRCRLLSIGLDAGSDANELRIKDKQFLIDVQALGEQLVCDGLKDILESTFLIMHNAKYDLGFLYVMDIFPKRVFCTMLGTQAYYAGDRIKHGLSNIYREFLLETEFIAMTGMTFDQYERFKEERQTESWAVPELSEEQLLYGSDDVRLIHIVYERLMESVDDWIETYERNFKPGQGLLEVVTNEMKLLKTYTMMELRGIPFDKERHMKEIVPFLERKREEFKDSLSYYPEFRPELPGGCRRLVIKKRPEFAWEFIKAEGKEVANAVRRSFKQPDVTDDRAYEWLKETKFSVQVDHPADGDEVIVEWYSPCMRKWVRECIEQVIPHTWYVMPRAMIRISHPDSLNKAVSKRLGHPIVSTEAKYLRQYSDEDPELIQRIIDYKNAADAVKNFGRKLGDFCTVAGLIHSNWNQMGAEASGRNSSQGPNIQQIPGRHTFFKIGKKGDDNYDPGVSTKYLFRESFKAFEGYEFVDADLSQIEPRLTAQYTGDKRLIQALVNSEDLHGLTAMACLDLDYAPSKISDSQGKEIFVRVYKDGTTGPTSEEDKFYRDYIGKTMNLAISYGIGPTALAEFMYLNTDGAIKWTKDEAKEMIEKYFNLYPDVRRAMDEYRHIVSRRPNKYKTLAAFKGRKPFAVVFSHMGRPRRFCLTTPQERMDDEVLHQYYNPDNKQYYWNQYKQRLSDASLAAYNHTIQSTAADLFKIWVYNVDRRINKLEGWDPWKMGIVACIHDEILIHAPKIYTPSVKDILMVEAEKAGAKFLTKVPVKVGVAAGDNWANCH